MGAGKGEYRMIRAITARTAAQAYKVLFWHLMDKGENFTSEDGADCLILDTVICHIEKPMEQLPELIKMSPLGPLAMEQYMHDFVDGVSPDDPRPMDFSYTYWERLHDYGFPVSMYDSTWKGKDPSTDQIFNIIQKIIENPFTRRAVACLWKPWEDINSHDPPCLDLVKFNVSRDGVMLNVACVFRSHDLIGGWVPNIYALTYLLKYVAEQTGRDIGYLEVISLDGHAYKNDQDKIDRMKEMLK
jgi:thymidylate synthase